MFRSCQGITKIFLFPILFVLISLNFQPNRDSRDASLRDQKISYASETPIQAEISIDRYPPIGEPATLTCEVSSLRQAPGTNAWIELPENARLVSGDLTWQGDLSVDRPVELRAVVVFTATGDTTVFCRTLHPVDENNTWGDLVALYLSVGEGASHAGFARVEPEDRMGYGELLEPGDGVLLKTGDAPVPLPAGNRALEPFPPGIEPAPEDEVSNRLQTPQSSSPEGSLIVTGWWGYWDRDDNLIGAGEKLLQLVDGNGNYLTWCWTNLDGSYTCPAVTNPGSVGVRTILYTYTSYWPYNDVLQVINPDWGSVVQYTITQNYATVLPDGTQDIGSWYLLNGNNWERAYWIQQDLQDVYRYIWFGTGSSQTPYETTGPGTVSWKIDSLVGNYYAPGGYIYLQGEAPLSDAMVGHEYGHNIMHNVYGSAYPTSYCPNPHLINGSSHVNCAWMEGWATFISMAANNDPDYQFTAGGSINLETPTWDELNWDDGDTVEGRVAGALWDMLDFDNDGFDRWTDGGIANIWDTFYHQTDNNFYEFWTAWCTRGHNQFNAVRSIYQNTIDYGADDYYEENDWWGTAFDLSAWDDTLLTDLYGEGIQWDEDWYKIYAHPGLASIFIYCSFTHSEGDIDIALYSGTLNFLASSAGYSNVETIYYEVSSPGTYYIRVYYGNMRNRYNLFWLNYYRYTEQVFLPLILR
jgi:hypothetical protein